MRVIGVEGYGGFDAVTERREFDIPATFIHNIDPQSGSVKKAAKYSILVDLDDYEYTKDKTRGERQGLIFRILFYEIFYHRRL